MKKEKLTERILWESKWGQFNLPIILDPNDRGNNSFIKILDKYFWQEVNDKKKSVIEIGCAPGKFLIHFAKNYNYEVNGIDYTEKGYLLTKKNLQLSGIEGNIIKEDIFKYKITKKFDVVISFGFIEHFYENVNELLLIHDKLLKKGGKLFITFPNFRYLNRFFSYLFRRDMLKMHNLEIMNKKFFKSFSSQYGYKILYLDYFGGIHPGGIKLLGKNNKKSLTGLINNYVINPTEKMFFLNNINSKYFSRYLGAIMEKEY